MGGAGPSIKHGLLVMVILGLMAAGCSAGGTTVRKDGQDRVARLQRLDVHDEGGVTTVVAAFDRPVIHNSVRLTDPPKLVVDLAGVELGGYTSMMKVDKGPVSYILPSRVPGTERLARLEIGLKSDFDYKITETGGVMSIAFEGRKGPEAPAHPETEAKAAQPAEKAVKPGTAGGAVTIGVPAEPKAAAPLGEPSGYRPAPASLKPGPVSNAVVAAKNELPRATRVDNITCAKSGDGCRVTISGNGAFTHSKSFMLGGNRLVVDIPDTGSLRQKQTIEMGRGCLIRVRMARHGGAEKKVRVVLDTTGAVSYDVRPWDKSLVVTIAPAKPSAGPGAVNIAKAAPLTAKTPAAAAVSAPGGAKAKSDSGLKASPAGTKDASSIRVYVSRKTGKVMLSSAPAGPGAGMTGAEEVTGSYVETPTKIYTGGKISFDVQDADLDKVIKLLADVAGLNLILDPSEVKGKVTLKLDNVPWDQALDILLRIYNLDKVLEGNVLRVAPKAKLDDEKKRDLMLITEQKKLKEDAEDLYTKTFKLDNATAADLEPKVKKILSKRGDAMANPRTNELIVTDVMENVEKAGKLIHILDKGVNQIEIEARIVEVDVNYSQSIGISWGLEGTGKYNKSLVAQGVDQSLLLEKATGTNAQTDSLGNPIQEYVLAVPQALKANSAGLAGNFSWAAIANELGVDLTIEALESIGKAEILSAPKVMTLENQAASIVNGETIYVQSTTAAGTAPLPLNANLSLTVTPRVTGSDNIVMDVVATDNQPATTVPANAVAAIQTKSVTTKVMVKDGSTIVLGGIYTKTNSMNDDEVPWLGRIPILGWLFKNHNVLRPTSELLIFITPKLVRQAGEV